MTELMNEVTEKTAVTAVGRMSVLIPVYNSESTIIPLVDTVVEALQPHFEALEVILVNDGSRDNSHARALDLHRRHPGVVKYIRLANNFGEHNAVMCGLNYVTGDCVAIIDDDFQNPPEEILGLVETLREGYDVVYSYYERKRHSWFRNLGSSFNDWVAGKVLRKPRGLYLSSFKVMNKSLVENVIQYTGPYPYIDGIILRSTTRIGTRLCRHASRAEGRSNYTLGRLIHLWLNMFTGFSVAPLRIAAYTGFALSAAAILLAIFFVFSRFVGGVFIKQQIPAGWTSLIVVVTLFAGVQLCVLGLIGEYLGRLALTINRTPQYVVGETHGVD